MFAERIIKDPPLPARRESATVDVARAAACFAEFMIALGLDCDDPHLCGTPQRVARMFATELFNPEPFAWTTFDADTSGLIVVRDIPFTSLCAHHFVPFSGVAHVGYIPQRAMVGLSKLARVVECFARRPQVQERLTEQIADAIAEHLQPLGVGVVLEARHLCMEIRGVKKPGATTLTSALRGALLDEP